MQKYIIWVVININILDCIGNTPLLSIGKIYFKLEAANPSGSIKDRVAKEMILPYIGSVHKNFTVVEATSGNTGISVAMVCASLGLKCWIICPIGTSPLKIKLMRQYGAKIYKAIDIQACIQKAKKMVQYKQADIYLDQFNNLYNLEAQKKMAKEVFNQLTDEYNNTYLGSKYFDYKYRQSLLPNAIVVGTGTGGTLMGLHHVFPQADIYEVYPIGKKPIEGITDGVRQTLVPRNLVRGRIAISYDLAEKTANMLMTEYGISCGISSGANYLAALMIKNKYKKILTVFADNRVRYL